MRVALQPINGSPCPHRDDLHFRSGLILNSTGTFVSPQPLANMHRALNIEEIVDAICCNLPTEHEPEHNVPVLNRQTTAAMARTCRSFYEPSMSALWRAPRSLRALVMHGVEGILEDLSSAVFNGVSLKSIFPFTFSPLPHSDAQAYKRTHRR